MSLRMRSIERGIVRAAIGVAMTAACSDATGPKGPPGSMRVLRKEATADTASSDAGSILVLQIFGSDGRPAARVRAQISAPFVHLSNNPNSAYALGFSADTTAASPSAFVLDVNADGDGRVALRVWHRVMAGTFAAQVRVPSISQLADSVEYQTLPASASQVVFSPADTAIPVGASYRPTYSAADRWGNVRSDPVTLSIADTAAFGPGADPAAPPAALTTAGTVEGRQTGRARLVGRTGSIVGSAFLSVIPSARIAAIEPVFATGDVESVVVVNLDGSALKRFPLNRYSAGRPRWMPGTGRLVVERAPLDGADPSIQPRLAYLDTAAGWTNDVIGAVDGISGQYQPAVAGTGAAVYFAGATTAPLGSGFNIYRVDANGTGLSHIGPSADNYVGFGQPDVSPDASALAVLQNGVLTRMDVPTGAVTSLGTSHDADEPRWSPDGRRIAFIDYSTFKIINADGSGERPVTAEVAGDVFPGHSTLDWSPDGGWLIVRTSASLALLDPVTGHFLPLPATTRLVGAAWRR